MRLFRSAKLQECARREPELRQFAAEKVNGVIARCKDGGVPNENDLAARSGAVYDVVVEGEVEGRGVSSNEDAAV